MTSEFHCLQTQNTHLLIFGSSFRTTVNEMEWERIPGEWDREAKMRFVCQGGLKFLHFFYLLSDSFIVFVERMAKQSQSTQVHLALFISMPLFVLQVVCMPPELNQEKHKQNYTRKHRLWMCVISAQCALSDCFLHCSVLLRALFITTQNIRVMCMEWVRAQSTRKIRIELFSLCSCFFLHQKTSILFVETS